MCEVGWFGLVWFGLGSVRVGGCAGWRKWRGGGGDGTGAQIGTYYGLIASRRRHRYSSVSRVHDSMRVCINIRTLHIY